MAFLCPHSSCKKRGRPINYFELFASSQGQDKENDCPPSAKKTRLSQCTATTTGAIDKAVFETHLRRQHEARITEDALKIHRQTSQKQFIRARVFRDQRSRALCGSLSSAATGFHSTGCGACGKNTCLACCLNYVIVMRSKKASECLQDSRKQRTKKRVNDLYKLGSKAAQIQMCQLYDQKRVRPPRHARTLPAIVEEEGHATTGAM
jgi:hypothetical protein